MKKIGWLTGVSFFSVWFLIFVFLFDTRILATQVAIFLDIFGFFLFVTFYTCPTKQKIKFLVMTEMYLAFLAMAVGFLAIKSFPLIIFGLSLVFFVFDGMEEFTELWKNIF